MTFTPVFRQRPERWPGLRDIKFEPDGKPFDNSRLSEALGDGRKFVSLKYQPTWSWWTRLLPGYRRFVLRRVLKDLVGFSQSGAATRKKRRV